MICLLLIGISGFGYCAKTDQLSLDLPAEEQEVYEWAKSNTADTDLFIIPPGLYHFRFFAQRGAYVDFKIFPASNPALIPEWRRRLEQVSHPDKIALAEKGYAALPYLDRTYATRNGSEEILKLLEDTEAKYFLRDVEGLAIPPFVPIKSVDDLRLEKVFSNDRFEVFRLKSGD